MSKRVFFTASNLFAEAGICATEGAIFKPRLIYERDAMKLIDEAIALLGDASEPLSNAFFKAQVIAHKIKDKEFAAWIKSEIQGYEADDDVPAYRIARIMPHGQLQNLAYRYNDMPLPLGGMTEEMKERFLKAKFFQSIAVIEGFEKNDKELTVQIDQRLYPFLRKGIDSSYSLINAWGKLPSGTFTQILNEARSRLLELLLNLSELVPDSEGSEGAEAMPKIKGFNGMFKGAVFGHGANINLAIGDGSQASHNTTSVVMNDIDSLVEVLNQNKVSEDDIAELKKAIKADAKSRKVDDSDFGQRVRGWLGSMIAKAGTPAWEVPAQVGAGLLTAALSHFYGF